MLLIYSSTDFDPSPATINELKRDLCLVSRAFSPKIGGFGVYAKLLLEGLKNKGLRITRIESSEKEFTSFGLIKWSFVEAPRKIKKTKAKLYHAVSPGESYAVSKVRGKKIVTIHDIIPLIFHIYSFPKQIVLRKIYKKFLNISKNFDLIIANSSLTKEHLVKYGFEKEKIVVINPCITPKLKPKSVKRPKNKFVVGTLARLQKHKRIDLLIKAIREIEDKDILCLIAGKGEQKNYLKKLAGKDKRIKFLGFIPENKKIDFYNSLDLFVFPSKIEGFGIPIVEALACKKPVLILEDSILPKETKKLCFITKKESLAEKIKEFKQKNIKPKTCHSIKEYLPKIFIERHLEIYLKMIY